MGPRLERSYSPAVAPTMVAETGVRFVGLGQYYHGGVGAFAAAGTVRMLCRTRFDALTANATLAIAGTSTLTGSGCGFLVQTIGGGVSGVIGAFSSVFANAFAHIQTSAEVGLLSARRTWEAWLSGGRFHVAVDGIEVGTGTATAITSFDVAGVGCGINTRANVPGSIGHGACTVVELQFCAKAPSAAELLRASYDPAGTRYDNATHQWVAADLGAPGVAAPATWTDRISGVVLNRTGAPTLEAVRREAVRPMSLQAFGDSIVDGRAPGPVRGNGWRKELCAGLAGRGRSAIIVAAQAAGGAVTYDYDNRCDGIGSQALGVATSVPARLPTLAADVSPTAAQGASTEAATVLAYGANDYPQRVNVLGETPAAAAANFVADVASAIAIIRAARPSARIVVQTCLRQATGASTAAVRSAIDLGNAALLANEATWRAAFGDVVVFDACALVTPTQADADSVAVLYDGIHPTAATYSAMGAGYAGAVLAG